MPRPSMSVRALPPPALALAGAVLLASCATQASRSQAYERSLAHWQGATEQSLRAAWGPPRSEEAVEGGKLLVYVTEHMSGAPDGPTFSIGIGGFGGMGSHASVGGGVGLTAPIGPVSHASGAAGTSADSCTTRFLVHEGRIESWTFEGGGCGAPVL